MCASGTLWPAFAALTPGTHWYRCIVNAWSIELATVLLGFDLQGWIAVIGGILLALITLFTGYDHVDVFGRVTVRINQQIGVFILLASLATLVVETQLASRRRNRERYFADRERNIAARRAQRQDRCTLAQLEFQFNANDTTRRRLSDLIALLREYGELA